MTNGPILVIRGETGANRAASPTLELLPLAGGGLVYFEWLDCTGPNNFYPIPLRSPPRWNLHSLLQRSVNPRSRILRNHETTLQHSCSVNNFLSGRTYSLEGAMMLMPQHALYHNPLIVLICGRLALGGGAEAIDR